MKLLSIAVPCYNCEKTLSLTLDSFCIDEMSLLDVIVVNDGSTDNSLSIASGYEKRYPATFRVIDKANGGHGSTINAAISQAAGKYFKVVDGDDTLEADGLRKLLARLRQTESDLIATHYKKVPAGGGAELPMRFDGVRYGEPYDFSQLPQNSGLYFGIHSSTFKTAILQRHNIRLQEHTFYVDVEYGLLPIPYVNTVEFLDVYTYRYTVGSVTQSIDPANFVKRYDDHYRVVRRMVAFAAECGADSSHKSYIDQVLGRLCFTHYMLAAFYDQDISRGRARAKEFDGWLLQADPRLYKQLGASRYIAFIRLTRFSVLPRGGRMKKLIRHVYSRAKRLLPFKRRFTY